MFVKLLWFEIEREIGERKEGKYLKNEISWSEMKREIKEGKVSRRRKMSKTKFWRSDFYFLAKKKTFIQSDAILSRSCCRGEKAQSIRSQLWWLCKVAEKKGREKWWWKTKSQNHVRCQKTLKTYRSLNPRLGHWHIIHPLPFFRIKGPFFCHIIENSYQKSSN